MGIGRGLEWCIVGAVEGIRVVQVLVVVDASFKLPPASSSLSCRAGRHAPPLPRSALVVALVAVLAVAVVTATLGGAV